jgi:hypothetical protein
MSLDSPRPMDASPLPFAALMGLGFLVGIAGHLYKSPATIGVGVFLIFLATILLPLGVRLN